MRQLPVFAAFSHAFRSTLSNLGFAFHASWPWMALLLPVLIAGNLFIQIYAMPVIGQPPPASAIAVEIGMGLLMLLAFSSIAIGWHRYILLDEVPQGWQRLRLDGPVLRYFGNVILISLVLGLIALPFMLVAVLVAVLAQQPNLIMFFFVVLPLMLGMFYRYSIKLPAIAVDRQNFGLGDALRVSKGNTWRVIGLGILVALTAIAIGLLFGGVTLLISKIGGSTALGAVVVLQLAVNWVSTIFSITVLTSLYGFFVEGREF